MHISVYMQSPLRMDMPGETTVFRAGEGTIDKGCFTVVMVYGRKLKPYVVSKGVRLVAELAKIPGVMIAYSRNGLMKDWISWAWELLSFNQRPLVWDVISQMLLYPMPKRQPKLISESSLAALLDIFNQRMCLNTNLSNKHTKLCTTYG